MKEIKLKKLNVKNFLSIGNEGITLDFKEGLNIITGINKDKEDSENGVGKSALADSIFFAIFGTPLRNIHVENISNWKTKKSCEVVLDFEVIENYITKDYRIIRTLNPSRVQLLENDINISRTVSKTNAKLKKLFGSTPDMYEQCILMSINDTEPFLSKSPATKRKFIEGIFKIDIFSEMLSIIRHDLTETKRLYNIEKIKTEEINKTIIIYRKQQLEHKNKREERIKEFELRSINNIEEINTQNKKIVVIPKDKYDTLTKQTNELIIKEKQYDNKLKEIYRENTTYQTSVVTLKERILEIDTMGKEICITCKRPFEEQDKREHDNKKDLYRTEIDKLNGEIESLNSECKSVEQIKHTCKNNIDLLVQEYHNLEILQKENENLLQRINQCNLWNQQIEIDINNIKNEKDTYINLLDNTMKRIEVLNEKLTVYQQKLNVLDVSKFVVSEEGVRSFIVKKMLKMLNGRLNYYLKKLDANCVCMFNEYFDETILNQKNTPCSYFNFSGGERKRIDLAMLFTFLDIRRLQSNISINITFYDELLDSSLDTKGIECVLDILKERINLYKEAVYIISHKKEAIKHATGDIVYLEKYDEITRRLNYDIKI